MRHAVTAAFLSLILAGCGGLSDGSVSADDSLSTEDSFLSANEPLRDGFNRADSTTLGNLESGQQWVKSTSGSSWGIEGGRAALKVASGSNTSDYYATVGGHADGTVAVTLSQLGQYAGLTFRHASPANCWKLATDTQYGNYHLTTFVAGQQRFVATITMAPKPGDRLKVVTKKTTIQVFINDALQAAVEDSTHQTAVGVGLLSSNDRYARFDDFAAGPLGTEKHLSDLSINVVKNGWGPVEFDKSVGESAASDGKTLSINGVTFAKGLGVHAGSEITYGLAGACSRFTARMGVDDEVGAKGSVVFQVFADATKLYDSGVVRGTDAARSVDVDVAGRNTLRLVVTDASDGNGYDHADWADARVLCADSAPAGSTSPSAPNDFPTSRSKYQWPFAADSIWNMPIGSNATYVHAGLKNANAWYSRITIDAEEISVDPKLPLKPLTSDDRGYLGSVHVLPTMSHNGGWNGCTVFLDQDKNSIWQGQPLRLTAGGNPAWRWTIPTHKLDLKGDGRLGSHGGSRLSALGGSIRPGELSGAAPIRHALKVNVYAKKYLSYANGGYRWPAARADAYASSSTYAGVVPAMRMGALVALKPNADLSFITNPWVKKIARAFTDYGAYVVDDTAWDVHAIAMDTRTEWTTDSAFHSELQRVFTMLHVVDNNTATNLGGGGTRRAPVAPAFHD